MARPLDDDRSVWVFDLGSVNAYLVDDGTVTLVDAGTPGTADDLRAHLSDAGYDVADIERVLITHYDVDHVGGLAPLSVDAPVHAMDPDAGFLDGSRTPPPTNKKGLLQRLTGLLLTRPSTPIERIADGDTVGGFAAYHTPGHTPGHVAFHHPGAGVAMLGDLVTEDDGELGTAPWPLAYSNRRNRRSIRDLAARDLEFDIACMGHGDPITEGGDGVLAALAGE